MSEGDGMNEITLQVKISLEDFFSSGQDRESVFKDAMQGAILRQLNDNQWVQSNIAHYIFRQMTDEVYAQELEKIQSAVRKKIDEFKEPDAWAIQHHKAYEGAMQEALEELKPEIMKATKEKAAQFMDDDGRDYNSFYGKIADAMVDKVFQNFVDSMVDKKVTA